MARTKLFSFLIMAVLLCAPVFAQHYRVTQSEQEFDVAYIQFDEMTPITIGDDIQAWVPVTMAFMVDDGGIKGQVRYSLFTDTGTNRYTREDEAALWMCMCLLNATGLNLGEIGIEVFDEQDAAEEFNADFGINVFCADVPSPWASGYQYMNIDFLGKAGQGIVMRTMLSNDPRFFGATADGSTDWDAPFYSMYHSFLFLERDASGNYIAPE